MLHLWIMNAKACLLGTGNMNNTHTLIKWKLSMKLIKKLVSPYLTRLWTRKIRIWKVTQISLDCTESTVCVNINQDSVGVYWAHMYKGSSRGPCIGTIYTHPSRVGVIEQLFPSLETSSPPCSPVQRPCLFWQRVGTRLMRWLTCYLQLPPRSQLQSSRIVTHFLPALGSWEIYLKLFVSHSRSQH